MTVAPGLLRAGIPADGNVSRLLAAVAATQPDRPALLRGDGRPGLTCAELADRASRTAAALIRRGLEPGGRVVVLTADPEAALITAVATLWAGGTFVMPPASSGRWAALRAVARTTPTAVVADPVTWLGLGALPPMRRARVRIATGRRSWPALVALVDLAGEGGVTAEPVPRAADAPALVSWTTGTTGRPHPVVRTHGVLAAQHAAIRELRRPRGDDVDLVGLPTMALHDLACGVPVVMPTRANVDPDGSRLRALVTRVGVTTAVGFPVLFERLVAGARPGALAGLRSVHVGGAPVGFALVDRLATVAPNASVTIVYGATEVEPIAAIKVDEWRSSTGGAEPGDGLLVGRPWSGIELRVVPTTGGADAAAGGHRGRIILRGGRVARDPTRSDPDGWLDTGDLGRIDGQGRLWLLGRATDGLPGGVSPAELEQPVTALPGVQTAVALVVPGRDGPRLVLAVQPAAGAAPAAVSEQIATLATERGWELDRVVLVRRIPHDARTGKIDQRRLRALVR